MKFEIVHHFDASPDDLMKVLLDPRLGEALVSTMPDLIEMETLEHQVDGQTVRRQARYQPTPMIRRIGPKKVEPRWMEWIEHSTAHLSTRHIDFQNIPRVPQIAKMMTNTGEIVIEAEGGGALRKVRGDLRVKVLLLGRIAEKMIHKHAKALLDQEARATAEILAAGGVDAFLEARA